jgi:restriction endonuclease Mrr
MASFGNFVLITFGFFVVFAFIYKLAEEIAEEKNRNEKSLKDGEERARVEKERLEQEREQKKRRELEEAECKRKDQAEFAARANWRTFYEYKSLSEIAEMSGLEFERLLARLLPRLLYTDIQLTPINDQGGDIICKSPQGISTVVQAKRWKKTLGNKVVQEVLGAMLHYNCQASMIITNSTFTLSALELASKEPRIQLCDYFWLEPLVKKHFTTKIPEFSWDDYNEIVVKNLPHVLKQPKRATDTKSKSRRHNGYRRRHWY